LSAALQSAPTISSWKETAFTMASPARATKGAAALGLRTGGSAAAE